MIENTKCIVGLKKDGGYIIPHEPDVTPSVQCDQPAVAMEKYADFTKPSFRSVRNTGT